MDKFSCVTWQMLNVTVLLVDYITTLMITPNLRNFSLILQSRNVCMKSVGTKVDFWERMHFRKFENVMVIFCKKKVTVVVGNITFCKGMNEPMVWPWFRKHFSHVITIIEWCKSWQLLYKVSFIFVETDLHLWSLSDCKQPSLWPSLRRKFIPLRTFLELYTHLGANSARSFQNDLYMCSTALNVLFFKKLYFWWMTSFFSLSSHLKTGKWLACL